MSDRELLELAAKAARSAGENIIDSEAGPQIFERYSSDGWECYRLWIPLTDDGDALRLAVKLKVGTRFTWCGCDDQYESVLAEHGRICCDEEIGITPSGHQLDEMAATRRAIVRAAAEIGRAMT